MPWAEEYPRRWRSRFYHINRVNGINPSHQDGATKAAFFQRRGFNSSHWEVFAAALKEHGAKQTVTSTEPARHGTKFVVECQLITPDGKNPCILSVWIQAEGNPPRLVTAHPNS